MNDILNPDKLTGKVMMGIGIGLASAFEAFTRPIGNLFKNGNGAHKPDKKGIPGDVVWDAYSCAQCGYCVRGCRGRSQQNKRLNSSYIIDKICQIHRL